MGAQHAERLVRRQSAEPRKVAGKVEQRLQARVAVRGLEPGDVSLQCRGHTGDRNEGDAALTGSELPTPLVSTQWLGEHLHEPGLVVVDASWYLPAMNRAARAEYEAAHIPAAVHADLDEISDRLSPLPHMFLSPEALGRALGILGIGNDSRVVVYDGSGANLSAARFWWTLRLVGHQAVAVLDGGLPRWRAEGRPVQAGLVPWAPKGFTARFQPGLVRSEREVEGAIAGGAVQLLDARSRGRFEGTEPEPRPGLRGGHLPGARSLPFGELTGPDGGLLTEPQLRARFARAGVDLERPVIASCGSGVTACVLLLGLEVLGHRDHAVYDGSWSEWGREGGPVIEPGPM